MSVIPFRIGEVLVAVEDVQYWSWAESPRWPRQLIVEARITWISSFSLKILLPEVQISFKGNRILLPSTNLNLSKFADGTQVSAQHSDTDEPCEWKQQRFYPKVGGKAWTAESATFYSRNLWESYREFFGSGISKSCRTACEPSAQILGVSANATRQEIGAAFRRRVKQVHPDYGGSKEAFQNLLEARDAMYAKQSAFKKTNFRKRSASYSS